MTRVDSVLAESAKFGSAESGNKERRLDPNFTARSPPISEDENKKELVAQDLLDDHFCMRRGSLAYVLVACLKAVQPQTTNLHRPPKDLFSFSEEFLPLLFA